METLALCGGVECLFAFSGGTQHSPALCRWPVRSVRCVPSVCSAPRRFHQPPGCVNPSPALQVKLFSTGHCAPDAELISNNRCESLRLGLPPPLSTALMDR